MPIILRMIGHPLKMKCATRSARQSNKALARNYVQCPGVPVGFFGVMVDPQIDPPVAHTAKP